MIAKVTKLSREEVELIMASKTRRSTGVRAAVINEYKAYFTGEDALVVGDWAAIDASTRNESLKNKRHALKAAKSFNLSLQFSRFDAAKGRVPFKVITKAEADAISAAKAPRKPRVARKPKAA